MHREGECHHGADICLKLIFYVNLACKIDWFLFLTVWIGWDRWIALLKTQTDVQFLKNHPDTLMGTYKTMCPGKPGHTVTIHNKRDFM